MRGLSFRLSAPLIAGLLAALLGAAGPAHAQLFSDNEARRAILEVREKVDATQAALSEDTATTRRNLLDFANQLESLRAELARVRGQNEQLEREVAELKRQQKDILSALDDRLSKLEPVKVEQDGATFTVSPEEKRDFDAAMAVLRQTEYPRAAQLYTDFMQRYPKSAYLPSAHYWLGNTQYALRDYKKAIASYQRFVDLAPSHPRVPEAKLSIANCQFELKDARSARKTLEALVKAHPQTEAAATAKDRLSRLR